MKVPYIAEVKPGGATFLCAHETIWDALADLASKLDGVSTASKHPTDDALMVGMVDGSTFVLASAAPVAQRFDDPRN